MSSRRFLTAGLVLVVLALAVSVWGWHVPRASVEAQQPAREPEVCADVRYLMERNVVPAELFRVYEGKPRVLQPYTDAYGDLSPDDMGDYWAFLVQVGEDRDPEEATVTLRFFDVPSETPLEFAVFKGMERLSDYTLIEDNAVHHVPLAGNGVYTLVVQLVHVSDLPNIPQTKAGFVRYGVSAQFEGGGDPATELWPLEDASSPESYPPQTENGLEVLSPFPSTDTRVEFHMNSLVHGKNISTQDRIQLFFAPKGSLLLGVWPQLVSFTGGNLSVKGYQKSFFLEDFGYLNGLTDAANLAALRDSNGTTVLTDWENIRGVWVTRECAGFAFQQSENGDDIVQFVIPLDPNNVARTLTFEGQSDSARTGCPYTYVSVLNVPFSSPQTTVDYKLCVPFSSLRRRSLVSVENGVTHIPLEGDRDLQLTYPDITIAPLENVQRGESLPIRATLTGLDGRITEIESDWVDLAALSLSDTQLGLRFLDPDRAANGEIVRVAVGLRQFSLRGGVIRLVYEEGHERLLLPKKESYIEIVTPPGEPTFNGAPYNPRALPGEPGYLPQALNNTGGNCTPLHSGFPEANCPPNGHINPANGNVWYGVVDLFAHGNLVDLALARSFNNGNASIDGPFGLGWTTALTFDYDVPFNPLTNSRVVALAGDPLQGGTSGVLPALTQYRTSLDLTWAPRGLVVYTDADGSRHVFLGTVDPVSGQADLRANMMPGWTLSRESYQDGWELTKEDGYVVRFDRAGRTQQFGYPATRRVITIHYTYDLLQGVAELGETPVYVTDTELLGAAERRLELYFDGDHRIRRAVLRVREGDVWPDAAAECRLADDCYEIRYVYNDSGQLERVIYPAERGDEKDDTGDRHIAEYEYNAQGWLTRYNDPRAPITPHMRYEYSGQGENSKIVSTIVRPNGETVPYEQMQVLRVGGSERVVQLTDYLNNPVQYTYKIVDGSWQRPNDNFTLAERISLVRAPHTDGEPTTYTWSPVDRQQSGALLQAVSRGGHISVQLRYGPTGQPYDFSRGANYFALKTDMVGGDGNDSTFPRTVSFPNGESYTYTYNDLGHVETITSASGEVWEYVWGAPPFVNRINHLDHEQLVEYWEYEFDNALGLPSAITFYNGNPDHAGDVTRYSWDKLGRLTRIESTRLGTYTIAYTPLQPEGDFFASTVTLTGPLGEQYLFVYDERGQLKRRVVKDAAGETLRQTNYSYDELGRVVEEARLLISPLDESTTTTLSTTYTYQLVAELPAVEGDASATIPINGYRVIATDPLGRQSVTVYDARGRVRLLTDELGYTKRFEYRETGLSGSIWQANLSWREVIQWDLFGDEVLARTLYVFDTHGNFRGAARWGVENGELVLDTQWKLLPNSSDVLTQALVANSSASNNGPDLAWGYQAQMPTALSVTGRGLAALPRVEVARDALGRPVRLSQRIDDDFSVERQIIYCPQPDGTEIVIRSLPNRDITCEAYRSLFELSVKRDHVGHVFNVESPGGFVAIYTEADTERGVWRVHFRTEDAEWEATYNVLGELLLWQDAKGIQREYVYDTLGRLRRVEVSDRGLPPDPEASYTFDYNAIGYLTSAVNDLGRGEHYAYNADGLLIAKVDVITSHTTSYEYDDRKRLQVVITPTGKKTVYSYDNHFPSRLVSVVTANTEHRFEWHTGASEATRTLIYTDNLGHSTTYRFDPLGLLQSVELEQGLSYTLAYNALGVPVAWVLHTPQTPRGLALRYEPEQNGVTITPTGDMETPWQWGFAFTPEGWLSHLQAVNVGASFEHNVLGQLQTIDAGAGRTWTFERAAALEEVTLVDAFGQERRYVFDSLYRTTKIFVNNELALAYAYHPNSKKAAIVLDVTRGDQTVTYTNAPAKKGSNTPATITVEWAQGKAVYTYNAEGELTAITVEEAFETGADGSGNNQIRRTHIEFVLGADGLPKYVINSGEGIESFEYDSVGNLSGYQNASGQSFSYVYNALNQLVAIVGPGGWKTVIGYDGPRVIGVCQTGAENPDDYDACIAGAGHLLESYTYDSLGRLSEQTLSNGDGTSTITYEYRAPNGALSTWGAQQVGARTQLNYEGSAADILQSVQMGPGLEYVIAYDAAGRIHSVQFGGLTLNVLYDVFGRVTKVVSGERSLSYAYNEQGYTITDDQSGAWVSFTYDENQHLRVVDYSGSGGSLTTGRPLLSIAYTGVDADNILSISLEWSDGVLSDLLVDARGNVLFVDHSPPPEGGTAALDVLLQYIFGRAGDPTQQSIQSDTLDHIFGLLDETLDESEYAVIVGYNEADQPITLRVFNTATPDAAKQLFYSQSFTYDRFGRVESETRQYHDGTRMVIDYAFSNGIQLDRQTVQVITPAPDSAQTTRLFTYYYEYDAMGNVVRVFEREEQTGIETTCAQFMYDTANHLRHVVTHNGGQTVDYDYDVQGRLVSDGKYVFIYPDASSTAPIAAYRKGDISAPMRFFVSLDADFALFQTRDGQAYHLFANGQGQVIGAQPVGEASTLPASIWLLDPYGRMISTAIPNSESGGRCFMLGGPDTPEAALQPPQVVFHGMFWDQHSNLFFDGGRVYFPGALQYLQRAPHGPDARGNLYRYPAGQTVIPLRRRGAPYLTGIEVLQESYANFALGETLTAESVLAQHSPPVMGRAPDSARDFFGAAMQVRDRMLDWLWLPEGLAHAYSVPVPDFDRQSGQLTVAPEDMAGQGDLHAFMAERRAEMDNILTGVVGDWLSPTFETAPDALRRFTEDLSQARSPRVPLRAPASPAWLEPFGPFGSEAALLTPPISAPNTPEDVLSYAPFLGADALPPVDLLKMLVLLEELPTRRPSSWIDREIAAALPTEPTWLPPAIDEVSAQWFTQDIFGLGEAFEARLPSPE